MRLTKNDPQQKQRQIDDKQRRLFMTKMTGLFGATTAALVLGGCSVDKAESFVANRPYPPTGDTLFSEHEMTLLFSICETILPRTDTPSAAELDCQGFVQEQLSQCHSKEQQQDCIAVLNKIEKVAKSEFSKSFALATKQQQQQLLVKLEQALGFNHDDANRFRFLKALIVFGYFTTEVGATQVLNYQAVPGGFKGDIKTDATTKTWGSLVYY